MERIQLPRLSQRNSGLDTGKYSSSARICATPGLRAFGKPSRQASETNLQAVVFGSYPMEQTCAVNQQPSNQLNYDRDGRR